MVSIPEPLLKGQTSGEGPREAGPAATHLGISRASLVHITPILGLNQSSLNDWMTFLFAEMHRPPAVGAAALGTAAVKRSLAERAQGTSVLRDSDGCHRSKMANERGLFLSLLWLSLSRPPLQTRQKFFLSRLLLVHLNCFP